MENIIIINAKNAVLTNANLNEDLHCMQTCAYNLISGIED